MCELKFQRCSRFLRYARFAEPTLDQKSRVRLPRIFNISPISSSAQQHLSSKLPAASAFGWADALGIRYAQTFRGAYISNFVCSALAVLVGATSLVGTQIFSWPSWPLVLAEIAFIIFIFVNTHIGTKRDWHTRWRESREVAERLRAELPMWLTAKRFRTSRGGEAAWPAWYSQAHMRASGLVIGTLDTARREQIMRLLIAIVDSQSGYHNRIAKLMHGVEHRIKRIGQVLFALTILFGAINLVTALSGFHLPYNWSYVLIGLTAALPALGAATFGIRLIGDFEGVAQRSEHTGAGLEDIGEALQQDFLPLPLYVHGRAQSRTSCSVTFSIGE